MVRALATMGDNNGAMPGDDDVRPKEPVGRMVKKKRVTRINRMLTRAKGRSLSLPGGLRKDTKPAMVCTADDLLGWRDFPKGLRVLLLDEDGTSAADIKSKLEEMDYIVSTFYNENEAISAISNQPESFHVAIVEVSTGNSHGSFRFLEAARDLPTITSSSTISVSSFFADWHLASNIHCLSTMMKCIALGAVEFLQKPLSKDKLGNIWQHVAHKVCLDCSHIAFNAGGTVLPRSLKLTNMETKESKNQYLLETEKVTPAYECDHEQSAGSEKFPAPSTPQLKQGGVLLDDGDCQDQPNCSTEKESREEEGESKSVETTCNNSVSEVSVKMDPSQRPGEAMIKEEDESAGGSKTESNMSTHPQNKDSVGDFSIEVGNSNKASPLPKLFGTRASRKKIKVDWTPELHKRFVQAVEKLGVDQAIPSRILELMKVEGLSLTRHNVASHLQKYRMHRRHILPKEEPRWQHPKDPMQRGCPHNPVMAFPPSHSNHSLPTSQIYPVWGHPSSYPSNAQIWGHPGYPTWQPTESWLPKTYPGMHADAWGCPVMPPPQAPFSNFAQNAAYGSHYLNAVEDSSSLLKSSLDLPLGEEEIDRIVKEAINKPWLPMPLGLKPPATESVLSELHRQGILLKSSTSNRSC
ncbi:hypothetical protein HHK36_028552 [Tetracentron sinense]|uniref:Two-component response regulator-like APRR2 n=1 Tax=Tetracentron sinense TaxID=13715 RepID=A0A835D3K0_TETSI|nr:hypothetical protein HHK36_028552 [Tetracentron sinense]